jgi:hypothetical protein
VFDKVDVGSWVIISGGKWYERLGAAIITRVNKPRWLNHALYFIYNKVLVNRSAGVYKVVSVDSAVQLTLDNARGLSTAAGQLPTGTLDLAGDRSEAPKDTQTKIEG